MGAGFDGGGWRGAGVGRGYGCQAKGRAGGVAQPVGDFSTSMQLLESGAFDGFARLHVAGHPEGNKDIDKDGGDAMAAVKSALGL